MHKLWLIFLLVLSYCISCTNKTSDSATNINDDIDTNINNDSKLYSAIIEGYKKAVWQKLFIMGARKIEIISYSYHINDDTTISLVPNSIITTAYDPEHRTYSAFSTDMSGKRIGNYYEYYFKENGLVSSHIFIYDNGHKQTWEYTYDFNKNIVILNFFEKDTIKWRNTEEYDKNGNLIISNNQYFNNYESPSFKISSHSIYDDNNRLIKRENEYKDRPFEVIEYEYLQLNENNIYIEKVNGVPSFISIEKFDLSNNIIKKQTFRNDNEYGDMAQNIDYLYRDNLIIEEKFSSTNNILPIDVVQKLQFNVPESIFNNTRMTTIFEYKNGLISKKIDNRYIVYYHYIDGALHTERKTDKAGTIVEEIIYNNDGTRLESLYYGNIPKGERDTYGYYVVEKYVYSYTY